jgi:hypothetical protein
VLVHLDDLAGMDDGERQAGCIVLAQLRLDSSLLADQDNLCLQSAGCLNGTIHNNRRGVIAAHGINHDLHVVTLLAKDRTLSEAKGNGFLAALLYQGLE